MGSARPLFDWLVSVEARLWVFLAACVVSVFLAAVASQVDLFWEMAVSAVIALVVSAQYGFFIGTLVFGVAFPVLYMWGGRKVRVAKPA